MATIRYSETADSGVITEHAEETLRGMVEILRGTEPSRWPLAAPQDGDWCGNIWFTRYGEHDYRTGEYENRSYHPASARDARYMITAWKAGN